MAAESSAGGAAHGSDADADGPLSVSPCHGQSPVLPTSNTVTVFTAAEVAAEGAGCGSDADMEDKVEKSSIDGTRHGGENEAGIIASPFRTNFNPSYRERFLGGISLIDTSREYVTCLVPSTLNRIDFLVGRVALSCALFFLSLCYNFSPLYHLFGTRNLLCR